MAVLLTIDWLIDGQVNHSETVPLELSVLEGIEKSVIIKIAGGVPDKRVTVRLQFDPGLRVPVGPE